MPESNTNSEGPAIPLAVTRICLDFLFKLRSYAEPCLRFLGRERDRLGLDGAQNLLGAYLARVWPDGLPGSMIVSNISVGPHPHWLVRPNVVGPHAHSFAARDRAPAFVVYQRAARWTVRGFKVVPHIPPRPSEFVIAGQVFINPADQRMERTDLDRLANLPSACEETDQKLEAWQACLDWQRGLATQRQTALRYVATTVSEDGRILFHISSRCDANLVNRRLKGARLMVAPVSASRDRWIPDSQSYRSMVKIGDPVAVELRAAAQRTTARTPEPKSNGRSAARSRLVAVLTVTLKPADFETLSEQQNSIPDEGFICQDIAGEMAPIKNQLFGIERLRRGDSATPFLPGWLFDISKAAVPDAAYPITLVEGSLSLLNDEQREAVRKAMAALDVFLIQGPPGTGKTTVAGEIIRQCMALGWRVLVASQANLAVENILAGLPNIPEFRPLRVGNRDRVGDSCKGLLEDAAPERWLRAVGQACHERVEGFRDLDRRVGIAGEGLSALRRIATNATQYQEGLDASQRLLAGHHRQREALTESQRKTGARVELAGRRLQAVTHARDWTETPDADGPSAGLLGQTDLAEALGRQAARIIETAPNGRWRLP